MLAESAPSPQGLATISLRGQLWEIEAGGESSGKLGWYQPDWRRRRVVCRYSVFVGGGGTGACGRVGVRAPKRGRDVGRESKGSLENFGKS